MSALHVAILGGRGITRQNPLPALALCPDTRVVARCDSDPVTRERARQEIGVAFTSTKLEDIVRQDDVRAVIIATRNFLHLPSR